MSDGLYDACGPGEDAARYAALARELEAKGDAHTASTAYDRAFGLDPDNVEVAAARKALLDRLSVFEFGLHFRYIPAGTFLMGSENGDPDERPVHPVRLSAFWMAETPISWERYCALMDWEPPPLGGPKDFATWDYKTAPEQERKRLLGLTTGNKIRLQYCENETQRARDWHAHAPDQIWNQRGKQVTAREIFGEVEREHPERPWGYDEKPMVSVSWEQAGMLCEWISTLHFTYRLPTEAEWEKAARGGRIGARYPWGNAPPTPDRCDFDRFREFSLRKMRAFPPNDYGLYAMSGGVWEWTSDWYDAGYYAVSPRVDPRGPESGQEHVLRGGSWAEGAETVTVSFRASGSSSYDRSPTVGFRLCRVPQTEPL